MKARFGSLILAVGVVSLLAGHEVQTQRLPQPRTAPAQARVNTQEASYSLGVFVAPCGELLEVVVESTPSGQSLVLLDENHERVEVRANGRDRSVALVTRAGVSVISPGADSIASLASHGRWRTNRMHRRECRNQPH